MSYLLSRTSSGDRPPDVRVRVGGGHRQGRNDSAPCSHEWPLVRRVRSSRRGDGLADQASGSGPLRVDPPRTNGICVQRHQSGCWVWILPSEHRFHWLWIRERMAPTNEPSVTAVPSAVRTRSEAINYWIHSIVKTTLTRSGVPVQKCNDLIIQPKWTVQSRKTKYQ